MLSFRAKIAFYLEDVTTAIGLTVNLLILALILLSLGIYVAQTYPLSATWQMWLRQLDWGILSLFGEPSKELYAPTKSLFVILLTLYSYLLM